MADRRADPMNVTTDVTFAPEDTMHLLEQGLPLTLLLDLADPAGPHSADILRREKPERGREPRS